MHRSAVNYDDDAAMSKEPGLIPQLDSAHSQTVELLSTIEKIAGLIGADLSQAEGNAPPTTNAMQIVGALKRTLQFTVDRAHAVLRALE